MKLIGLLPSSNALFLDVVVVFFFFALFFFLLVASWRILGSLTGTKHLVVLENLRPAAPPPEAVPPSKELGEFTPLFVAPPPKPAAQTPGEFTRGFQAPQGPAPPASPRVGPPSIPPNTPQPGEFTQMLQAQRPAAPPDPASANATQVFATPPAMAPPNIAPHAPPQGPGEYTQMFAKPASLTFGQPPGEIQRWAEIEVFFATDREATGAASPNTFFSGNRNNGELTFGTCRVTIPRNHRLGALESPRLIKFEFAPNPQKHVVLLSVTLRSEQEFFENLSACVRSSERTDALVFIHGYNVSFADAARRTAQISYDLGFHGAPILYSWPSVASVESYAVDEATIEWTVPHLKLFLKEVATKCGAQIVHVVADSMGN